MLVFVTAGLSGRVIHADECRFEHPPTVVSDDGKYLLQFWDIDDSPVLQSGLMPHSAALGEFVQYVRERVDVSEPARYLDVPALSDPKTIDGQNNRLALSGKAGDLKPINCLEALLFSKQAERHPMATQPAEFLSYVLKRTDGGKTRYRILFYTVDQPLIGRFGPIADRAEAEVAAGWRPYINLHNHNFFFDKKPIIPGGPWPSANDVQVMKGASIGGYQFEWTAVTNGFVTSHMRHEDLMKLKGADEK